jgi:hypothetical protein
VREKGESSPFYMQNPNFWTPPKASSGRTRPSVRVSPWPRDECLCAFARTHEPASTWTRQRVRADALMRPRGRPRPHRHTAASADCKNPSAGSMRKLADTRGRLEETDVWTVILAVGRPFRQPCRTNGDWELLPPRI